MVTLSLSHRQWHIMSVFTCVTPAKLIPIPWKAVIQSLFWKIQLNLYSVLMLNKHRIAYVYKSITEILMRFWCWHFNNFLISPNKHHQTSYHSYFKKSKDNKDINISYFTCASKLSRFCQQWSNSYNIEKKLLVWYHTHNLERFNKL